MTQIIRNILSSNWYYTVKIEYASSRCLWEMMKVSQVGKEFIT